MCDEWKNDFMSFYTWSMDNGYQDPPAEWSKYKKFIKGLSIDRIDGSKDYCPENCRWIPMQENMYNNKYHEAFQKRIAERRAKEARRYQELKEKQAKLKEKWAKQGR
jgi:wyosine [tRNA(Phe)-imidazoG37] synthetase (radical SAM superfamily)